ncbi:MAG: NTP transferase domain-containing protein [Alphaproteobacteria bacterium]|nr:NTP transferase domain-containing protein [Alphaproteobacteria bacterium SS10]
MKAVILAGGKGARLGNAPVPKPLTPIDGRPIIEHVMAIFGRQGVTDFTIATGHNAAAIDEYLADGAVERSLRQDDWRVRGVDTGAETATGGRLLRLRDQLGSTPFFLTWTDGLADIDLRALYQFHQDHGKLVTVTAVYPPPRFGHLSLDGDRVTSFAEKPTKSEGRINGAFFVMDPKALDYIADDQTMLEDAPMQALIADDQLRAYRHNSFWQCMDTPAEAERLDQLARSGAAPWLVIP